LKDYYAILGISPTADTAEIKQAYRKLAMRYHPDKHDHEPEKIILYEQIREAYEILTEPVKRNEYLQERWRLKAQGLKLKEEIISGDIILKKVIELNQQLRFADPARLNETKIRHQFNTILSDEMIGILEKQNDNELNLAIFSILIDTLKPLPLSVCTETANQIDTISFIDYGLKKRMDEIIKKKQEAQFWEKRKIWIVIAITILICLFIGYLS
jgi:curved DNA-binding protein CbpA